MLFCLLRQKTRMDPSQNDLHTPLAKSISNRIGSSNHTGQTCNSDEINISVEIDLFNHLVDDPDLIGFGKERSEEGEAEYRKRVKGVIREFDPSLSRKDEEDFLQIRIADCGLRIQI